jgi:hypothetical protein
MQNPFDITLPSCSALSILENEQLFGTAPLTQVWIMLEYPDPFGGKALEESKIPGTVKAYLTDTQKTIPASRLLLIRQDQPKTDAGISAFVGLSSIHQPRLYEFHLSNYDELLNLDLSSLSTGKIELTEYLRTEPLFLVCTNGKRDPCCAQWGQQVYLEMAKLSAGSVWQTSHVGGHRFAANVICLPHGIYYGRLRPDQANSLLSDYQGNCLSPQNYRGRAHYPSEVQVAEYYLASQISIMDIDGFQLLQSNQIKPNLWEVIFVSRVNGTQYNLVISAHQSTFENYESCSTPDKRAPRLQYQLETWSKS